MTPPEAFVHWFSLTARDTIIVDLGPLDALFPGESSTAHDAMLTWRNASFSFPQRPRFMNFNLLSQFSGWNLRLFELIDLRHRSSHDSIKLVCYCVQLSRTLCANSSMLGIEESYIFQDKSTFALASSMVPAIQEANDPFSTSQDLSTMTISKFPELIAEVSLTHHELACGMLLDCFCLRFSMAYQISLYIFVVCSYSFKDVIPNLMVEDLVNFSLFGI